MLRRILFWLSIGLTPAASPAGIPGVDLTGGRDATSALQIAFDQAGEGATLVFDFGRYRVNGVVEVKKSVRVDFNGSTLLLQGGWENKGFRVAATTRAEFVEFSNGILLGDGTENSNQGPVISSVSGCQVGRFVIRDCTFRDLTYGCNFNCSNAGFIRYAELTGCLFENIVGRDHERGKGAAFSFNPNELCSGRSHGNVFIDCGRHSLYCSTGGRFLSDGDYFYRNNVGGETTFPLAAVSLARGSHMRITNGYFEECRDGISLTCNSPRDYPIDVSISRCTFVNNERYDVMLNSDNPQEHGMHRHVVVSDTRHLLGRDTAMGIVVPSFDDMRISGVDVHDRRTSRLPSIWILGNGPSHSLLLDNVRIITENDLSRALIIRPEIARTVRQSNVSISPPHKPGR